MSGRRPTVAVVVCTYADERFDDLLECIASVRRQTLEPLELAVVVDHNPRLLERVRESAPTVLAVENRGPKGLASARNTGVAATRGNVVAFLDDDAFAEPEWLEHLARYFDDDRVAGVGGSVLCHWSAHRPRWFPEEFDWVVGCTYRGLPTHPAPVRNLIGASMSFRRSALAAAGGFALEMGRTGSSPLGNNEDTELSIRVRRSLPGCVLVYAPESRVRHRVPPARATWRYFLRRCLAEGLAKADLTRRCGADEGLSSERAYVARVLPLGVARGLRDTAAGDGAGAARSLAIAAGLVVTTAGYAIGRVVVPVRRRWRRRRAPAGEAASLPARGVSPESGVRS